jgi:hypothetical protein
MIDRLVLGAGVFNREGCMQDLPDLRREMYHLGLDCQGRAAHCAGELHRVMAQAHQNPAAFLRTIQLTQEDSESVGGVPSGLPTLSAKAH